MSAVFAPLLLFVISIGIFVSYLYPSYMALGKQQERNEHFTDALTQKDSLHNLREELNSKFLSFAKKDTDRLAKLLPDQFNAIQIIIDLDALATETGVRITRFSPSMVEQRAQSADATSIVATAASAGSLKIHVVATYEQFLIFLRSLESSLTLYDVTDLSLGGGSKASVGDDSIELDLTLKTYWLPK